MTWWGPSLICWTGWTTFLALFAFGSAEHCSGSAVVRLRSIKLFGWPKTDGQVPNSGTSRFIRKSNTKWFSFGLTEIGTWQADQCYGDRSAISQIIPEFRLSTFGLTGTHLLSVQPSSQWKTLKSAETSGCLLLWPWDVCIDHGWRDSTGVNPGFWSEGKTWPNWKIWFITLHKFSQLVWIVWFSLTCCKSCFGKTPFWKTDWGSRTPRPQQAFPPWQSQVQSRASASHCTNQLRGPWVREHNW